MKHEQECPCRSRKAVGCHGGECLCNRAAFPRSGDLLARFCLWDGHGGKPPGVFPFKDLRFGGFKTVLLDPSRKIKVTGDET